MKQENTERDSFVKSRRLKDQIIALQESRSKAGFVYDYDNEGNVVRVDGLPLTRDERRMFERMETRRKKKLNRLLFQVKKEQKKVERYEELKKRHETKSSDGHTP